MQKLEVLKATKVCLKISFRCPYFIKTSKKGKKPNKKFSNARIKKIRKIFNESRYKFSKLKIKEIRKNLYEIENEKNPSESKIKEIERNLIELEENLLKQKSTMIMIICSYYKNRSINKKS